MMRDGGVPDAAVLNTASCWPAPISRMRHGVTVHAELAPVSAVLVVPGVESASVRP